MMKYAYLFLAAVTVVSTLVGCQSGPTSGASGAEVASAPPPGTIKQPVWWQDGIKASEQYRKAMLKAQHLTETQLSALNRDELNYQASLWEAAGAQALQEGDLEKAKAAQAQALALKQQAIGWNGNAAAAAILTNRTKVPESSGYK